MSIDTVCQSIPAHFEGMIIRNWILEMDNKKIREYIVKITGLVHDINSQRKHHIFLDYSGHVNQLSVSVYINGWIEDKESDYKWSVYWDKGWETDFEKNCKDVIKYLKNLKS